MVSGHKFDQHNENAPKRVSYKHPNTQQTHTHTLSIGRSFGPMWDQTHAHTQTKPVFRKPLSLTLCIGRRRSTSECTRVEHARAHSPRTRTHVGPQFLHSRFQRAARNAHANGFIVVHLYTLICVCVCVLRVWVYSRCTCPHSLWKIISKRVGFSVHAALANRC